MMKINIPLIIILNMMLASCEEESVRRDATSVEIPSVAAKLSNFVPDAFLAASSDNSPDLCGDDFKTNIQ